MYTWIWNANKFAKFDAKRLNRSEKFQKVFFGGGYFFKHPVDMLLTCCRKSISVHCGKSSIGRHAQSGVWRTWRGKGWSRSQKCVFVISYYLITRKTLLFLINKVEMFRTEPQIRFLICGSGWFWTSEIICCLSARENENKGSLFTSKFAES